MRGSTVFQIEEIFKQVNEIGASKHSAKAEARNRGARTWHELGKSMGIMSYATADAYREVWRSILNFAKYEFEIRDIERLSGDIVKAFLVDRIKDGVAHATLSQYASAAEKLELALNRYAERNNTGKDYSFSADIREARLAAKELEHFEGSRAYQSPGILVEAINHDNYHLVALIQHQSGARISEANHLTKVNLRGLREDRQTGQVKGWLNVSGKGGKIRDIGVSPQTYNDVISKIGDKRFEFDKDAYRNSLKTAAGHTHQDYEGSHGLRWSWAQRRHQELQKHGFTYEQSLTIVSQEMGHERADITEHYLK